MYIVFFERSYGGWVVIGETDSPVNAMRDCISPFLKSHNYTPPYVRTWAFGENLDCMKFDVGSHTEFFEVLPEDCDECRKRMEDARRITATD